MKDSSEATYRSGGCACGAWIGEPKIRRSSARARRGFCSECGAQLAFYTDARPHEIDLTLASLDEPETVTPKRHLYIKSRIAWIALADGLPQHHERAF